MNKTVAITGANGFIGKALIQALVEDNYNVIALVHNMPNERTIGVQYHLFNLGESIEHLKLLKIDVLIHLAFEFKQTDKKDDVNLSTAKSLKKLPIQHFIFVSSFAVVPPITNSYYGRCKAEMENLFENDLIIRPGLVLGNGGLFGKIYTQLKKSRVTPLINGGTQLIYTISLEDLIRTLLIAVKNRSKGLWHVAHNKPITFRQLTTIIANKFGIKPIYIPIPVKLLRILIGVMIYFKKPTITKDNLEGLLTIKKIDTRIDMENLKEHWINAEESILKLT